MADLAQDLRAVLLAAPAVAAIAGTRIHQGIVPESSTTPYLWYRRASRDTERVLGEAVGAEPDSYRFDLEAISADLEEAQDLADAVRGALDNYRGSFGTRTAQGVFVENQDDDYYPRGIMGDETLHYAALSIQIFAT